MSPTSGRTTDGQTTCSSWSGTAPGNRTCKRAGNEPTRTLWKSWHIIDWRLNEPPSGATALIYSEGVQKAADHATFRCVR
jgi:hypothetical protein